MKRISPGRLKILTLYIGPLNRYKKENDFPPAWLTNLGVQP